MRSVPSTPRRVAPATFETLEQLVAAMERIQDARLCSKRPGALDATNMRLRDRALVLLGFAFGRRGSELADPARHSSSLDSIGSLDPSA